MNHSNKTSMSDIPGKLQFCSKISNQEYKNQANRDVHYQVGMDLANKAFHDKTQELLIEKMENMANLLANLKNPNSTCWDLNQVSQVHSQSDILNSIQSLLTLNDHWKSQTKKLQEDVCELETDLLDQTNSSKSDCQDIARLENDNSLYCKQIASFRNALQCEQNHVYQLRIYLLILGWFGIILGNISPNYLFYSFSLIGLLAIGLSLIQSNFIRILIDKTHNYRNCIVKMNSPHSILKNRIIRFYSRYEMFKLLDPTFASKIATRYLGKEDELFKTLVRKYGKEPKNISNETLLIDISNKHLLYFIVGMSTLAILLISYLIS